MPKPDNDPSELQWTYLVIVAALVTLSRIDISIMDEWLSGPGRQTTHHSGLVVYSHVSLKILTPCDGELPRTKRRGGGYFSTGPGVRDAGTCIPNPAVYA